MEVSFSTAEENYLKTIFHLQQGDEAVTTNEVAAALNTSAASVTDMMKRLHAKKVLHYQRYYGFTLSAEGRKIALGVIRRHRLWEYFLAQKLGFGWSEVHGIAEELEHVQHKQLIDRLDAYLGHPAFDPHGDPIPDNKGRMQPAQKIALAQLPLNQKAAVVQVTNQSEELLQLLEHKQINIGTRLQVKKCFPFDQSYEIKTSRGLTTISEQLAKNIFVRYEK